MRSIVHAALATLLVALPATPQARATDAAAPPDTFVLEPGSHEVPDLIDRAAAYLDCNILYSLPELQNVAGQIRITRPIEVDRKGCQELLGSLLYHKGLAMLALDPDKGLYEVIAMQGPRSREIASSAPFVPVDEVENYASMKATPIMTSVSLENINATVANNALRPFFANAGPSGAGGLTLGNVGNNSDVLIVGFGPQVASACRLLKLVDVGDNGAKMQVRVVRLEHAVATEVVRRIEDVLARPAMQVASQAGIPTTAMLHSVAHPELNAVILSGTEAQVRDAEELIAKLDLPAATPGRVTEDLEARLKQLEARLAKIEKALGAGK